MAVKKNASKEQRLRQNILEQIRKPELWIGVFTVGVLLGIVGGLTWKNRAKLNLTRKTDNQKIVSPVPKEETKLTVTPGIDKKIKKLAFTASTLTIVVKEGDNYWKITKKACGDGKYFLNVAQLNENQPLHPGDVVKVKCE